VIIIWTQLPAIKNHGHVRCNVLGKMIAQTDKPAPSQAQVGYHAGNILLIKRQGCPEKTSDP
jgi:hypothetical protein